MSKHARLSPSSASRWLLCPGSVALCDGLPEIRSVYADQGTAAHALAERAFTYKKDAKFFIGETIYVGETGFVVDEDMASAVQVYLEYVRRLPESFTVLHEQKLPLTPLTGEEGAEGTADTIAFDRDTLLVVDYKNGRGVEVDALDNEQMMMYAAAARAEYRVLGNFTKFKVAIVQPNCDNISEFEFTNVELDEFVWEIDQVASSALGGTSELSPSDKACRWCKAKAICPALKQKVIDATSTSFDNLDVVPEDTLSDSMSLTDLVEDWARAVRAEVESRLLGGVAVRGFKLVRGRMGARQWTDEKAVLEKLKTYPDDIVFTKKLTSPTQIEKKIAKDDAKTWRDLQDLVICKEGAPSVAFESDERPALNVGDSFTNLDGA